MPIKVKRMGSMYVASMTPPHGRGVPWTSPEPMSAEALVEKLEDLGCHTSDIGDAMFHADPLWLNRVKDEH